MKNLFLILIAALFLFSCGKKEEKSLSPDDQKKKELELKEKQLDSIENEMKKDSINKLNSYKWEGDYEYVIKDGKIHEWHFELKINKLQSGYSGVFDISGHQTYEPMNCTVTVEGNKAKIYFDKYHDEPMLKDMNKGDLLAELEYNSTDIITHWHKAKIFDNMKSGVVALKKVKGDSFSFMNKDIEFGSSFENFLVLYTEFKVNNELKSGDETGVTYTSRPKGCEINYNVYFNKTGLFKFEMKSNCSSGQDEKIIKIITSQFKFIPSKDPDAEEMGDITETYKKGKLTATAFIGGFYMLTIERSK